MKTRVFKIDGLSCLAIFFGLSVAMTAVVFGQAPSQRSGGQTSRREIVDNESGSRSSGRYGPEVVLASDEDYQLAPSDVIRITIEDAPELSANYRINKSGTIPMKYLGTINVAGKTTEEVGNMIADGLRNRYLKDPKVYVTIEQYNSRTFFIQGSVNKPGLYIIEGRPSLFKLISVAGGLVKDHGSTAYIIREAKSNPEKLERARSGLAQEKDQSSNPDTKVSTPVTQAIDDAKARQAGVENEADYEIITAQIGGLYRGRFDQNIIIQPNDFVYVPPTDVFFVAGEVKSPGQYTLREGTTLRQAMSLAQGTFFRSKTSAAVIFRQDLATGKLTEVPVDVGAVMNGKSPDVPIMPNDVIMVPNSKVKTISGALLQTIGTALVTRAILGGN